MDSAPEPGRVNRGQTAYSKTLIDAMAPHDLRDERCRSRLLCPLGEGRPAGGRNVDTVAGAPAYTPSVDIGARPMARLIRRKFTLVASTLVQCALHVAQAAPTEFVFAGNFEAAPDCTSIGLTGCPG